MHRGRTGGLRIPLRFGPLLRQRIGDLRRHVVFVVLGQHLVRNESLIRRYSALRYHALALAKQVGQDSVKMYRDPGVEMNSTCVPFFRTLPCSTRPPMRKRRSSGALPSRTSVGL